MGYKSFEELDVRKRTKRALFSLCTLSTDVPHSHRADDQQILQKAIDENRILVTLDEHFGDWVILPLSKHPGVIRLKVNPTTSDNVLKLLIPFLRNYSSIQFKNHLIILSNERAKWVHTA